MRVGQEIRFEGHQARLNEANISKLSGFISPESPYLWCFLTVAANSNDRSSDYIRLRPLEQRLGKNWVRTVAEWLTECISGHEACSHQSSDKIFPPTRVIDVGPSDGSEIPFLCTCRDGIQEWVTLSHCWGQSPPLKTTVSSLPDHQRGLPLDKLPRLFHDAVLITRDLGYRYLWIDSLCIVQDSREDWIRESAYMGNIYKHSVFTISADNCRDSRDNILENHSPIQMNYVKQRCCSSKLLFRSEIYAFSHCEWKQNYKSNHSVLGSRAWALQEQVLSPRTLHWTPLQIAWSCRCTTRSEEDPTGSHPKDLPADNYLYQTKLICLSQEGLQIAKEKDPLHDRYCGPLRLWYLLVMQFCARRITFEEDSLSAVSGLAKEVNRQIGKEYLAGIWAHDIHNGLLWSVGAQASYPSTYVAPSWSWASIKKGRLVHPACMPMTEKSYLGQPVIIKPAAKILETHVTYAWGDNFGPVVSGKLRI
ncbi:heterokaryon incompatibility protein-domain-containing protein, partial [Hyaloscypha sp. PMI_1271]